MQLLPTEVAEAAHAFLAPSASARWEACPGSALMESLFPELGDDAAAREGTACHWVMAYQFAGTVMAEGSTTPNGVVVTRAMLEAVDDLQADIEMRLGPNWRSMIIVERRVSIPRVHAQCWGTPDVRAWIMLPNGRRKLIVWDLKFGFKRIEAFECLQLVAYASGCLSEANDVPAERWPDEMVDCELIIHQPRAYHPKGPIRVWNVAATGLADYVFRLSMAADEACGPTPVCKPRPDACENCRARSGCEALQEAAYRGMEIARQATPRTLSTAAAGLELAMLDDVGALLEARKSGLEEVVKHRLQQGERVPFWYYGPGQGKTAWTKPAAEILTLGQMLGVNLAKPLEPITPKQAMKAGLSATLAAQYSEEIPGAVKLTRSDGSEVRKVFSNVS